MEKGQLFRFKTPTLAISNMADGQRLPVTVPTDAIVQVIAELFDTNGMVEVLWQERRLMVFAKDVAERGKLVRSAAPHT